MKLRKLKIDDAEPMLEWMHDVELCAKLRTDFASKTLSDCVKFIECADSDRRFVHFAIASDSDEYMGTVSLKNISLDGRFAEFGIVVRRCAMGLGYSFFGMREIIKYGFSKLNLKSIYWCVSEYNIRACKFYNKHNFHVVELSDVPQEIREKYEHDSNLIWYEVKQDEIARIG